MGGEADLHEWITTVISCSSNKKRSREGFKWEVMPSGGKLVSAFTQVLHLKGNCGILNTQALYSHVLVCKWITLSKTFGISPVDILSWQPRHVCCGCSAVLLGHSECFQTDPYREIFFFFFFLKKNMILLWSQKQSHSRRSLALKSHKSWAVAGGRRWKRWRNCHQNCIIKGSHCSRLPPASSINPLERFQNV